MNSYSKIFNYIKHCKTKDKIIPFKQILEYTSKEKIISKNSTKTIIPKGSKFKSFTNFNNKIKNILKYHNKDNIETPKHKIKNIFINSRNENNKLFLSNKISTNSSYKSKKYNTIEGRQLSARKRYPKNIFSMPKTDVQFPELNLFKKENELFKSINDNENLLFENYKTIKLDDTNSKQTSTKKLSKSNINHQSTFQKGNEFNLLKLINNSQNKKISNLKQIYYQTEMKNNIQTENNEIINYNNKKANKNESKLEKNKTRNLVGSHKLKTIRGSAFNFKPKNQHKIEKSFHKEIYISSDSGRIKTKEIFNKKFEIMFSPYKKHKHTKRKENLNKKNYLLLSENESKSKIKDKKGMKKNRNSIDNRNLYKINRSNTLIHFQNLKKSYNKVDIYIPKLLNKNKNKSINNSSNENENKSNLFKNKKLDLNDFLKRDFFKLGEQTLNTGKNIIIFSDKKSTMDIKKFLYNFFINKDEEEYIKKKRMKINNKIKESNKSSYLYKEYAKELKYGFLRNVVINQMTEKLMEDFKPLENQRKDSIIFGKDNEIYFSELFNVILDKCHKIYYSFEDIIKIGKSLLKHTKIEKKIKINNNYFLEKFNVYQILLKQFENKWKLLQKKDCHYYKRMNGIFSSIKIKDSNQDFYIYKYRIKNDLILSLDNNSFKCKLSPNKINNNILNDKNNNINKTIKYKDDNTPKISPIKNNKINLYNKFINLNSGNKKRFSFFFEKMGLFGFDNNLKIIKKNPNDGDPTKLNNKDNFDINDNNKNIQLEKEKEFNIAESNIHNYNILKNKKLFNMNNNEEKTDLKKEYSKKNNLIDNFNSKYLESIAFKYHDLDSMSKVASVIKKQEIERDDPDSKFFYKIVDSLSNRKTKDFEYLIKNEEEALNRSIKRQEISTGNTLLMYATIYNLRSIVELLLKKGAEPNIQNNYGNSALHLAYKNENIFIINLLLEYGAEQKIKNINGLYPWQMSKLINN